MATSPKAQRSLAGSLYSLYLFYLGAPVLRKCTAEKAAGFTIVAPPEAKPWGEHELRIAHPDGHVFRVAATITAP